MYSKLNFKKKKMKGKKHVSKEVEKLELLKAMKRLDLLPERDPNAGPDDLEFEEEVIENEFDIEEEDSPEKSATGSPKKSPKRSPKKESKTSPKKGK